VAVFGVTLVSDFIALEQHWIRLLGGLILLGIGYATFRARPLAMRPAGTRSSYLWGGCSAALLVFTNPLTLFAYAAAFVVLGVKGTVGNPTIGLMLVAGVFVGSLAWFALLTEVVHWLRARVMRVGLTLVNRVAGVLLMLCSVYVLWNGIRGL
jgi:arginine exporter protein ArgO